MQADDKAESASVGGEGAAGEGDYETYGRRKRKYPYDEEGRGNLLGDWSCGDSGEEKAVGGARCDGDEGLEGGLMLGGERDTCVEE